jgi:hypothetical protein
MYCNYVLAILRKMRVTTNLHFIQPNLVAVVFTVCCLAFCLSQCWMQTYPKVLKLILRFLWSILMAPGASAGGTSERSDISESRNNACFVDEKCAQIDVQKSYCVDLKLHLKLQL